MRKIHGLRDLAGYGAQSNSGFWQNAGQLMSTSGNSLGLDDLCQDHNLQLHLVVTMTGTVKVQSAVLAGARVGADLVLVSFCQQHVYEP